MGIGIEKEKEQEKEIEIEEGEFKVRKELIINFSKVSSKFKYINYCRNV